MAKLIFDWLNEELVLSRRVDKLDGDFTDGYLLGEILAKYNQIIDFDTKFIPRSTPDAKINNFCVLERSMRDIGISHFNSKLAFEIMEAKPGVMLTLLSQLKGILERIKKNNRLQATLMDPCNAHPSKSPTKSITQIPTEHTKILKVIKPSRPLFDKTMSMTFENKLRAEIDNPTDLILAKGIKRFTDRGIQFQETLMENHSNMMEQMRDEFTRKKEINKQRKLHEKEFLEAWELNNTNQWKDNQRKAHDRRETDKRNIQNAMTRQEIRKTSALSSAREETYRGIAAFDKRLETEVFREDPSIQATIGKALIKTAGGAPGTGIPEIISIDKEYLKAGFESAQKKVQEHHEDKINKQQSHDRRRRKFLRDRENVIALSLQASAENEITNQLLNTCQAEDIEQMQYNRVKKYKDIFCQNRYTRDELIRSIDSDQLAKQRNHISKNNVFKELNWVIEDKKKSQFSRYNRLQCAVNSANRKITLDVISHTVDTILDLVDWVSSCRSFGLYNTSPANSLPNKTDDIGVADASESCIPMPLWLDAKRMFSSELPFGLALPYPEPSNISSDLPYSLSDKPLCSSSEWLFSKSFEGKDMMPNPINYNGTLEVASNLAIVENNEYIYETANVNIPDYDSVPSNLPPVKDVDTNSTVINTPAWLRSVQTKYVLGDTITTIRTTANPLPSDPLPLIEVPRKAFRLLLVGTDENAKINFAKKLNNFSNNTIVCIYSERLVHSALNSYYGNSSSVVYLDDKVEVKIEGGCIDKVIGKVTQINSDGTYNILCDDTTVLLNQLPINITSMEQSFTFDSEFVTTIATEILAGNSMSDELTIQLLIHAILQLDDSKGFVVVDYPNTYEQGVQFVEKLSGINYDLPKPAISDSKSIYAPCYPSPPSMYDVLKCGLDKIIVINDDITSIIDKNVCTRRDLNNNNVVTLDNNTESVDTVSEVVNPLRPSETNAIDLAVSSIHSNKLVALANKLGILLNIGNDPLSVNNAVRGIIGLELLDANLYQENNPVQYFENDSWLDAFITSNNGDGTYNIVQCGIVWNYNVPSTKIRVREFIEDAEYRPINMQVDCLNDPILVLWTHDYLYNEEYTHNSWLPAILLQDNNDGTYKVQYTYKISNNSSVIIENELKCNIKIAKTAIRYRNLTSEDGVGASITYRCENSKNSYYNYYWPDQPGVRFLYGTIASINDDGTYNITEGIYLHEPSQVLNVSKNDIRVMYNIDKLHVKYRELIDSDTIGTIIEVWCEGIGYDVATLPAVNDNGTYDVVCNIDGADVTTRVTKDLIRVPYDDVPVVSSEEPAVVEEVVVETVPEMAKISLFPNRDVTLSPRLAKCLSAIWNSSELRSIEVGRGYSMCLRDTRCQQLQRRRIVHDIVMSFLVRRDEKQDIYEEFRSKFNEIEGDFRYDPDCIAELHLRALELSDTMLNICDRRQKEVNAVVDEMARDGIVNVFIHRCRCEASAMLQAEYSRFISSLHLLFDYSKAITGYDYKVRYANLLEETLPISSSNNVDANAGKGKDTGKGGKDAGKGGKGKDAGGAVPTVYRTPVTTVVMNSGTMSIIPDATSAEAEEVIDPKAKGKAPAKGKGKEEPVVSANVYDSTEKSFLDLLGSWCKGTFTINRTLYDDDEEICVVIENAVWHEAERLKASFSLVRKMLDDHCAWLLQNESSLIEYMKVKIENKYQVEMGVVDCLVNLIRVQIQNSEPIVNEWLVATDAIVVCDGKVVLPLDKVPPVPEIYEYYPDRLSKEQYDLLCQYIQSIQMGDVVLNEDIDSIISRLMSHPGPLSSIHGTPTPLSLSSCVFPKTWRESNAIDKIKALLIPSIKVEGIDEYLGVTNRSNVVDNLSIIHLALKEDINWLGNV